MQPDTAPASVQAPEQDTNLWHLALIIVFGIFASTLPQPQSLASLPIRLLLKNDILGHDPDAKTKLSFFFFACGLFWYIKPLSGILTDAFPLFGTKRRGYLLASSVLAAASWVGFLFLPHSYNALLWGAIVINLFMVMMSTVVGAVLVEAGQKLAATGRLTSVRQAVFNGCGLINGFLGGYLGGLATHHKFFWTPASCAVMVLTIFPVAHVYLREQRNRASAGESLSAAGRQAVSVGRSGTLWFALLFVFLFYFAPGFGTVLLYRQTDELHLTPQFIGNIGVASGAAGVAAAFVYGMLVKVFNIRVLLGASIAVTAITTLLYLFYNSPALAILIDTQNGFFFGMCEVAVLDMAARATPAGAAGLAYGLILSVRNVANNGADLVGSSLSDRFHWKFPHLVFLNAATTAVVLILLPLVPKSVHEAREG